MLFRFSKKNRKKPKVVEVQKKEFTPNGIDEFIRYVKEISGINLEPKRDVLVKKFNIYCSKKGYEDFYELLTFVKSDKEELQDIMDLVTVNETYFYRELCQLQESMEHIRELDRSVSILSAPCASGEEVYSLALLADQIGIRKVNMNILGIDINSQAISNAKEAIYSERSLHRLDDKLKDLYFEKVENRYHIKKENLSNIEFKVINIFDDDFKKLGRYDIIFSRNMMIYFNDEYKQKAVKLFHDLLTHKGRLYTGHADLVPESEYFNKIVKDRLYFYEKR